MPEGSTLLYEAEWNEGASKSEHLSALLWFAHEGGYSDLIGSLSWAPFQRTKTGSQS